MANWTILAGLQLAVLISGCAVTRPETLADCGQHAADDPHAQMGAYLFDDGIRVSGGGFDESGV